MNLSVAAAIWALCVPGLVRAQTEQAGRGTSRTAERSSDVQTILKELSSASTVAEHERAVEHLKSLPASALQAIGAAMEDPATGGGTREDLQAAYSEIMERLRQARQSEEARLEKDRYLANGRAYQRVGRKDPRWDALAMAALEAADGPSLPIFKRYQSAVDAGCVDPLVQSLWILEGLAVRKLNAKDVAGQLLTAVRELDGSDYPDAQKFRVWLRAYELFTIYRIPTEFSEAERERIFLRIVDLYPSIVPVASHRELLESAKTLLQIGANRLQDSKRAFDEIAPMMAKAMPGRSVVHDVAADFYVDWAWEARGDGYAYTVPAEAWPVFEERLTHAEEEAKIAYREDPLDSNCSSTMITVCMGKGYARVVMESWFERAMAADPDCLSACLAKLTYLYPKWHGSEDEALEFGHWCVKNGTAANGIPRMLLEAHLELRARSEDAAAYMLQPEVWADIQEVFTKLLDERANPRATPENLLKYRARYLRYAVDCRQWGAFKKLAAQFGDQVDMQALGGKDLYAYFQKQAAANMGDGLK
jgi:hypothetical protein